MADALASLSSLPTEVLLLILSRLDPPSLARCSRVCRSWSQLCVEEDVWRRIALHCAYAPEGSTSIQDLRSPMQVEALLSPTSGHCLLQPLPCVTTERIRSRFQDEVHGGSRLDRQGYPGKSDSACYFKAVETYRELCKRKWCLDRVWHCSADNRHASMHTGTGDIFYLPNQLKPVLRNIDVAPPFVGVDGDDQEFEEVGRDVWRIKLDPESHTIISTGQRGGIRVTDITTNEVLWRLDRRSTRHYPHAEFDRGYLIFDRIGHGLFDVYKHPYHDDGDLQRGVFIHYTTLASPRPTRALRFQYPFLVVATRDGHVLIWDVELKSLTQEISLTDSMHAEGNINYIDFDDDFVFLVGTGARCISIVSRKLGQIVWTLADHLEVGMPGPATFTIAAESSNMRRGYCALDRRQLKKAKPSPWQNAPSRLNFAQLMMTPGQSWAAIHPDFRSRTLVILGETNVLLIRDYLTCFLAWEAKVELESKGIALPMEIRQDLLPTLFADLQFDEAPEQTTTAIFPRQSPAQLAVADSRAICIVMGGEVGKPMLLDLDPLRQIRNDVRNIAPPTLLESSRNGQIVTDEEAGFAVYKTIRQSARNHNGSHDSSITECSCVVMDSTSIYAVQANGREAVDSDLALLEYHDVLQWSFSQTAYNLL